MVGLSVILENYADLSEKGSPQIINKGSIIKPTSPTSPPSPGPFSRARNPPNYSGFLQNCSLCSLRLLPGKDIYMYKGDKAFCTVECRYRQIFMDEEEGGAKSGCTLEYNCSMAATSAPTSSSSSSRSSGKGARNAFAY